MSTKIRIRVLCLLLCAAVLLPCVSSLAETTKVTAYLLRLREGPSTSAKVLDAYPRGTRVTILKKGDDWTKVKVHEKTGYMQTSMLAYSRSQKKESGTESSGSSSSSSSSSASSSSGSSQVSTGKIMYIMKGIRLFLREGPDSSAEILGSFRGGTAVEILKRGKYWSRVFVKGMEGYMGNSYLVDEKE